LTLVATADSSTTSAVLHVTVIRDNTAPTMTPLLMVVGNDQDQAVYRFGLPVGPCIVHDVSSISLFVQDAEGDDVTVDVEAVVAGEPFSGTPTASMTAPMGIRQSSYCQVKLPTLVAGHTYQFALRVRDALGATSTLDDWGPSSSATPVAGHDGWVTGADPASSWGFPWQCQIVP
jgi:hypothetical protein